MGIEFIGDEPQPPTIRCQKCGAYFWDAHVCARDAQQPAAQPVAKVSDLQVAAYNRLVHSNGSWSGPLTDDSPLFTTPQPRPVVDLTNDDLEDIAIAAKTGNLHNLRVAIEAVIAAHIAKNGG